MATIQQLREATGKSRARVAADLNMSERHLYRLETGKTPLRRVLALGFASYYDVPVEQIDGLTDSEATGAVA
jgi:transcriptional regulator with XRE-family HTH domain